MTHEQFVYWLKGFTEGKEVLSVEDYKAIKEKLNTVYTYSVFAPSVQSPEHFWYNSPVTVTTASSLINDNQ